MLTKSKTKELVNAIVKLRNLATDEQAVEVSALYPNWGGNGINYKIGERVMYDGTLYKVITEHTSQIDWNPKVAPSLFAKVLIPNTNIISEWEQPDSTNAYMNGDKVSYNGKIWVSIIDNNVWSPDTYGWQEIIE